jgi:hypothetical protein
MTFTDGQAGTRVYAVGSGLGGAGTFNIYDATSSSSRVAISSTGNVTVNAPASGHSLTVNGINGYYNGVFQSGASTQAGIAIAAGGGVIGTQSFDFIQDTTGNGIINNRNSGQITFAAGASNRVIIGAAGNVTINAPASGVPLTVNGVSGQDQAVFKGPSGQQGAIQIQDGQTGANVAAIHSGYCNTAVPGVMDLYNTGASRFCINSGMYAPAATGGDQGVGTINVAGLYVNGTPVGSLSATTVTFTVNAGCTTSPTVSVTFTSVGKVIFAQIPHITCTSNGSPMTLAGSFPSFAQRTSPSALSLPGVFQNNSSGVLGIVVLNALGSGSGSFTFAGVTPTGVVGTSDPTNGGALASYSYTTL